MTDVLRSVLVVDDDPAVRRLLREGLPMHLEGTTVTTAVHGGDAIQHLCKHPVNAIVTDVSMPIMDGFTLLAYVRKHHPNLPVVVLSAMAAETVMAGAPELGMLRILRKPASPAQVAEALKGAYAESASGRLTGVPLAALLHLIQIERKSCSLLVRSGERKGRLHFLSGELVNAYSFELGTDGEAAARQVLGWHTVTVDFERSLHNHQRLIHTPLQALLLDVATAQDERERLAARAAPGPYDAEPSAQTAEPSTPTTEPSEPTAEPSDRSATPSTAAPEPGETVPATSTEPVDAPSEPPSEPVSLADVATTLHQRLTALRARCETTGAAVVALHPHLEHVQQALAADARDPSQRYDEAAVDASLRELAAVAARLAQVAEALATRPGEEPQEDTSD